MALLIYAGTFLSTVFLSVYWFVIVQQNKADKPAPVPVAAQPAVPASASRPIQRPVVTGQYDRPGQVRKPPAPPPDPRNTR